VDVTVKRESKYLCTARLCSYQTLWQHQRKQRREKKVRPTPDQPVAGPQNGHTGTENNQLEAMAKYSETAGSSAEPPRDVGDEQGLSLAESFLLGTIPVLIMKTN
jgi:hypothetical protein